MRQSAGPAPAANCPAPGAARNSQVTAPGPARNSQDLGRRPKSQNAICYGKGAHRRGERCLHSPCLRPLKRWRCIVPIAVARARPFFGNFGEGIVCCCQIGRRRFVMILDAGKPDHIIGIFLSTSRACSNPRRRWRQMVSTLSAFVLMKTTGQCQSSEAVPILQRPSGECAKFTTPVPRYAL